MSQARTLCGRSRLAAQRYLFVPTKAEAAGSHQLWSIMSSREEDVRVNGDHQLVADGGANGEGEGEGELEAVMQQLEPEGVRALHARVEAEWGPVLQSACQTAAARALWARSFMACITYNAAALSATELASESPSPPLAVLLR
jgi:hypothetical protein